MSREGPVAARQGGGGRRHPRRARRPAGRAGVRRRPERPSGSVRCSRRSLSALLTTVASAARWCIVARGLGLRLPLAAAVSDCYRAVFLNSVLPAGVLGDVHRAVGYGRSIGDVGRGVRVVAIERVTGQLAIIVVGLGVLLASRPTLLGAMVPGRLGGAELLAALVALGAAVLWTARDPRAARIRTALRSACTRGPVRRPLPVDVAGPAGAVGGHPGGLPRAVRRRRPGRGVARDGRRAVAAARARACSRWLCRSTSAGGVRAKG